MSDEHIIELESICKQLLAIPAADRVTLLHQFCDACGKHDTELAYPGPCMCDVDPEV